MRQGPLPGKFLAQLSGREEVLVTSRGVGGSGRVRMWFAATGAGYVYLLTPAFSLKARRWLEDPWVRLTVPDTRLSVEGVIKLVQVSDLGSDLPLILERFAMAGAITEEALTWMLESGSHLLLRAGLGDA